MARVAFYKIMTRPRSDTLSLLWSDLLPLLRAKPAPDLIWFRGASGGLVGAPGAKLRALDRALRARDPEGILVEVIVPQDADGTASGLDGGSIRVQWKERGWCNLWTAAGVRHDVEFKVGRRTEVRTEYRPPKHGVEFGKAPEWPADLVALNDPNHRNETLRHVSVSKGHAITSDGHRAYCEPSTRADGVYSVEGIRLGHFSPLSFTNLFGLTVPRSAAALDLARLQKISKRHNPRIRIDRPDSEPFTDLSDVEDWTTGDGSVWVYLVQLVAAMKFTGPCTVGYSDPLAPVLLRGESGRMALVMPCARPKS